ncbi:hypothetical protein OK411_22945 [Pseudomonas sp. RG1]|uniref:hypothetical protein n=1 Tax=Pseudomonas sp. RG1 TaxID=2981602 RepID=UPI00221FA00D|nr:hypothetical protein [Pseudomonas sp. RG1]MCW0923246.1 hypothetical protein [Pseudomonas sp. RG1]
MEYATFLADLSKLTSISSNTIIYDKNISPDVPPTNFLVRTFFDPNLNIAPLIIVSEPTSLHYHVVQNASERLAAEFFPFIQKVKHQEAKLEKFSNISMFMASVSQHGMQHLPFIAAKPSLSPVQSAVMAAETIIEGWETLSDHLKINKNFRRFLSLLEGSLILECSNIDREVLSLVTYESGNRQDIFINVDKAQIESQLNIKIW